jgi:DNA-directed RNA polymerase III subunit RPC7
MGADCGAAVEAFFPPELQRVIAGSKAVPVSAARADGGERRKVKDVLDELEAALEHEEPVEEEVDDDYNDVDDDEDDYNAEQYFDNGEDDGGEEGAGDYE